MYRYEQISQVYIYIYVQISQVTLLSGCDVSPSWKNVKREHAVNFSTILEKILENIDPNQIRVISQILYFARCSNKNFSSYQKSM